MKGNLNRFLLELRVLFHGHDTEIIVSAGERSENRGEYLNEMENIEFVFSKQKDHFGLFTR